MKIRSQRTRWRGLGVGWFAMVLIATAGPGWRTPAGVRALAMGARQGDDFRVVEAELKDAVRRGDLDAIAQWVEHMGSIASPRALNLVLKVGEKFVKEPVRSAVINVLVWSRNNEDCIKYLVRQIGRTGRAERDLLIVEALDRIDGHPLAQKGILEAIGSKDLRVVIAAVRALRHKPSREAIDALIELYERVARNQDLVAAETRITLIALTKEEYRAHEDWANWWVIQREKWVPPPKHRGAEVEARTAVYRPSRHYDAPEIFGQEVPSKRVVFVIDTSQSMYRADPIQEEEGGSVGSRVRIERAKAELIKVINALRPDTRFNIVAYNTWVHPWKNELVPASRRMKEQAVQFIASWEPEGHTHTLEALLTAMSLRDVDTILLLSDGSPTIPGVGSVADIPPILEAVRDENRFRQITIHTLGFTGAKVSFMKALAKENHGTYAPIK